MVKDSLSKEQTIGLRAILCILVVFAHSNSGMLYELGRVAVAVFFFLSGFALVTTTWNKELTPKYIFSKFFNLIVPVLIVEILYRILYHFYDTVMHYNTIKGTINGLLHFEPPVFAGWYMEILIILFAIYFISLKASNNSKSRFTLVFSILYAVLFVYNAIYGKSLPVASIPHFFLIGILFYFYRKEISSIYKKNYWINYLMLILPLFSLVFMFFTYPNDDLITNIARVVFANLFPLIIFYLSLNINLDKKPLKFICDKSIWIYLTHVGFQYILVSVLPTFGFKFKWISITLFLVSFILAFIISFPLDMLFKLIKKNVIK